MTEPTGVGAELRQARQAQGLAITDVAQQLKFAPRQIESLENEHFDRLPGPTIARGMVRSYARLLQLEPEPLLSRMVPRVEATRDPAELAGRFKRPVPFSDNTRRSTMVYVVLSAGVLILVGAVAYEWQQERATPQFVAPAQPQRAPEPPEPPARTASAAQLPRTVVSEPPPVAEEKREPAAEEPKPEPAKPAEKPPIAGLHHIVLRCEQEAWLEVHDAEGRALVSSLNPAGSERVVRGRGPFSLVIGNAQHVKLFYDGKPVDLQPHIRVEVARLTLK